MSASLMYLLLRQVLRMLSQLARDGGAKDVESRDQAHHDEESSMPDPHHNIATLQY
ncbi:hypothetical protein O7631_18300 [Micromonospora sp. WMMD967]|uniref:hypothetical protein n=1 Tax=Micromonospora sp. WMMD967 TaxID=3016101 RepID=UPI002417199D|nr:hypothetical protein [Micromonospora sp. WMMD967]MDG4838470.1 hypothetical protein [Micromonospora sp. WMMD967]